jgi:hypothetical protein
MRMAKAPQEHIDKLRVWMQFNDELCKIDPTYELEWKEFKKDWEEYEEFVPIIKHCEDDNGFNWEYYWDYYRSNISHIHMRILMGYDVLVDNVCDPDLDYLDYKPELKKQFEFYEKNANEK